MAADLAADTEQTAQQENAVQATAGQQPRVVVLDYGSGNVHSVYKALAATGAEVTLTADREEALVADGLVVPGVGAFDSVMRQLEAVSGAEIIAERLAANKPVIGFCVGLQILFSNGYERGHKTPGLNILAGDVRALPAERLPHMGWNTVTAPVSSKLFAGVADERFYFVHSNAVTTEPAGANAEVLTTWAEYGGARFVAAVEAGPLAATQFHPEKSGEAGLKLLANWVRTLRPQN